MPTVHRTSELFCGHLSVFSDRDNPVIKVMQLVRLTVVLATFTVAWAHDPDTFYKQGLVIRQGPGEF